MNKRENYIIVRHYRDHDNRTIRRGITFDQAQAHCRNPETSSTTCKKRPNKRHTEEHGPWFDGYEEAKS